MGAVVGPNLRNAFQRWLLTESNDPNIESDRVRSYQRPKKNTRVCNPGFPFVPMCPLSDTCFCCCVGVPEAALSIFQARTRSWMANKKPPASRTPGVCRSNTLKMSERVLRELSEPQNYSRRIAKRKASFALAPIDFVI
jgi:hypothetical protein